MGPVVSQLDLCFSFFFFIESADVADPRRKVSRGRKTISAAANKKRAVHLVRPRDKKQEKAERTQTALICDAGPACTSRGGMELFWRLHIRSNTKRHPLCWCAFLMFTRTAPVPQDTHYNRCNCSFWVRTPSPAKVVLNIIFHSPKKIPFILSLPRQLYWLSHYFLPSFLSSSVSVFSSLSTGAQRKRHARHHVGRKATEHLLIESRPVRLFTSHLFGVLCYSFE